MKYIQLDWKKILQSSEEAALHKMIALTISLAMLFVLSSCGGGGNENAPTNSLAQLNENVVFTQLQSTGDFATDGLNLINYRRQQIGLSGLNRNPTIDAAAQAHSVYQKINNLITHTEIPNNPRYFGATQSDRLFAAGYAFNQGSYAYGEVISATTDESGFNAADSLIAAIYHRFLIFEPTFKEVGAEAASVPNGYTYFTVDFTANGFGPGLGSGNFVTYPKDAQVEVPKSFFSDNEAPDPVPSRNEVGYPISIHADINAVVEVQDFTVRPRGGVALLAQLLTARVNADTPLSAAAIIPLDVLAPATTYDVQFIGTINGIGVNRMWSFTTAS